jgi:hypothetical protein
MHEFFLVLDEGKSECTIDGLLDAVANIGAYYLDENPSLELPSVISVADVFQWKPTGLLFDEPRGEPEELEAIHIRGRHVRMVWAVPLLAAEVKCIESKGIDYFDRLADERPNSLTNLGRQSLC